MFLLHLSRVQLQMGMKRQSKQSMGMRQRSLRLFFFLMLIIVLKQRSFLSNRKSWDSNSLGSCVSEDGSLSEETFSML